MTWPGSRPAQPPRAARPVALAATAAIALLLLPIPAAAATEHHADYQTTASEDDTLRAAADSFLTELLQALRLAGLEPGAADRHTRLALDAVDQIGSAYGVQSPGVDRPALTATLGAATLPTGRILAALWHDYQVLADANATAAQRHLALAALQDEVAQLRASLEGLRALGFGVQDLEQALTAFQDRADAIELPPVQPGSGPKALQIQLYDPQVAFDHVAYALVTGPAGTAVTVAAFSVQQDLVLSDAGSVVARARVPWDTSVGPHPITATTASATVSTDILVVRLATHFTAPRIEGDGLNRTLLASLLDEDGRGLSPADVDWSASGVLVLSGPANGTAATQPGGSFAVRPAPLRGQLAYAGNRTHDQSTLAFGDVVTPGQTAAAEVEREFHAIGETQIPSAPTTPWLLVASVLFALLLVVGLEVEDLSHRLQPLRAARANQASRATQRGRRGREWHPLLDRLEQAGESTDALTLREAGEAWKRLGAPGLDPWLPLHEEAYYARDRLLPVPPRLDAWARRGAR